AVARGMAALRAPSSRRHQRPRACPACVRNPDRTLALACGDQRYRLHRPLVGAVVGAVAGISRGSVDAALMWLADLFLSLPQLPLLLLVMYLFRDILKGLVGPEGGVFILIVLVIGTFRWMPVAR